MEQKYYYVSAGQPVGPITFAEIVDLFRIGKIHRGTSVFIPGLDNWTELGQLPELLKEIKSKLGDDHLPPIPKKPSEPTPTDSYFVGKPGEKPMGPLTAKQILEDISQKRLSRSHFVFDAPTNEWIPLFTHPEFDRRRLLRASGPSVPREVLVPVPKSVIRRQWLARFATVFLLLGFLIFGASKSPLLKCWLGHTKSCTRVADRSFQEKNWEKASQYFSKSCQRGEAASCYGQGLALANLKSPELTQPLFQRACELKYGRACLELAKGLSPDNETKLGFLSKACEYSDGEGCLELGILDLSSNNNLRAQKYFQKACSLKNAFGCNRLALLLSALGEKEGERKALKISCDDLGNPEGCAGLGHMLYSEGSNISAEEYLSRACAGQVAAGCSGAGNLAFLRGDGDVGEALAKKGCDLGESVGCGLLGRFYQEAKKIDLAVNFYEKACDLSSGLSCFSLGKLLKASPIAGKDPKVAFAKACKIDKKYCP